ncbi:MAG TPA: phage baseplate protein [Candidatus Angelobacter sp.]|jgi:hypothetical protein
MQESSTQVMLNAWERAKSDRLPVERALSLLTVACPSATRSSLAALPIGKRDALLFALREQSFGPEINALADCPACKQRVQFQAGVRDLVAGELRDDESLLVESAGYQVEFRRPSSADLIAARQADKPREELLARLIVRVARGEAAVSPQELPQDVVGEIESAMEAGDPQANLQLTLRCQTCGYEWEAAFDIAEFLWSEIDAWASRTLFDVHCLARAYGWRETDIIAMNPWRRQCYLEMLNQ